MWNIRILLKKFYRDDRGGVEYTSLMLITAVVTLAGMVGLVQIRDQVTQQFGDVAVAIDHLDQSFSYTINLPGPVVISSSYADPSPTLNDPVNAAPACIVLNVAPAGFEGSAPPSPAGLFP